MKVAILNYGAGNIKSIQFALQRLGFEGVLTDDEITIRNADRVIFPGVGEASSAMKMLRDTGLHTLIPNLKQPVLGICLGMQLMCNSSEEGRTKGLGIFNAEVTKFPSGLKIPQIGWNTISKLEGDLFNELSEDEHMYTVHSYYVPLCDHTIATTTYGQPYSAALKKDNFFGVQFHPEKSSNAGEKVLRNFLRIGNTN